MKLFKPASCAALILSTLSAHAGPDVFQSLPNDTVVAARLNLSQNNLKAIKQETQLGKLFSDPKRIEKIKNVFEDMLKKEGEYEDYKKNMNEFGLEDGDLHKLLNSRFGFSFATTDSIPNKNIGLIFMWVKNEPALINKFYSGFGDNYKLEKTEKRIDQELSDTNVISLLDQENSEVSHMINLDDGHLILAIATDLNAKSIQDDFDSDDFGDSDISDDFEPQKLSKLFSQIKSELKLQTQFFQDGFADEVSEGSDTSSPKMSDDDFAQLKEISEAYTSQLISAQKGPGTDFYAQTLQKEGMRQNTPEGDLIMEVVANLENIKMPANAKNIFAKFGKLSAVGTWLSYKDNLMFSNLFVSLPENQRGYLELLNQPHTDGKPETWVPKDLQTYSQVAMDLPYTWSKVKEILVAENVPNAAQIENQVNTQLQMSFQSDLNTLLKSFGKKVEIIEFKSNNPFQSTTYNGSAAIVLDFNNPELMNKILMTLKGLAGMSAPGTLIDTPLLGFNGFRIDPSKSNGVAFSVHYGKNKLIISLGDKTDERVVNLISTPPAYAESLANSAEYNDFHSKYSPDKVLLSSFNDAGKTMSQLVSGFNSGDMLENMALLGDTEEMTGYFNKLKTIIPSEDEIINMFKLACSSAHFSEHGLVFKSTSQLPEAK
jgi:hypothetical protein